MRSPIKRLLVFLKPFSGGVTAYALFHKGTVSGGVTAYMVFARWSTVSSGVTACSIWPGEPGKQPVYYEWFELSEWGESGQHEFAQ